MTQTKIRRWKRLPRTAARELEWYRLLALPLPLVGAAAAVLFASGLAAPAGGPATMAEELKALAVQVPDRPVAAPDFTLAGADGHPVGLKGLRGKVVFLNFWATWCVPCRAEMPALERLHQAFRKSGLAVVAVNLKESRADVQAFLKELHLSFPAVLDRDGAVASQFAVRSLPVTTLVDRDGAILWKALGSRPWDGPQGWDYLERLLASTPR